MASNAKKVGAGIGALAGAAAAAAAGYYFYASKDAEKNRKIAAKWASSLKNDVVKQAKKVQNLDKKQLAKIIDTAAAAYETARSVDKADLARAMKELKGNWQELVSELDVKGAKRSAKSTVKAAKAGATKRAKVVKKVATKAVKSVKKAVARA